MVSCHSNKNVSKITSIYQEFLVLFCYEAEFPCFSHWTWIPYAACLRYIAILSQPYQGTDYIYIYTITLGFPKYYKYQCLLSSFLKLHNLPINQSSYTKHLCYLDLLFISCFKKKPCNLLKTKYFLLYVIFEINMVFKLLSIHNFSQYLHTCLWLSKNLSSFLMPAVCLIQNETSYII